MAAINAIVDSSTGLLEVQRALLVAQGSLTTSLQSLLNGTLTLSGFQAAISQEALQAEVDSAVLSGELWAQTPPSPAPSSGGKSNKVRLLGFSSRVDCRGLRGDGTSRGSLRQRMCVRVFQASQRCLTMLKLRLCAQVALGVGIGVGVGVPVLATLIGGAIWLRRKRQASAAGPPLSAAA